MFVFGGFHMVAEEIAVGGCWVWVGWEAEVAHLSAFQIQTQWKKINNFYYFFKERD
jgi:hypothetical protein